MVFSEGGAGQGRPGVGAVEAAVKKYGLAPGGEGPVDAVMPLRGKVY